MKIVDYTAKKTRKLRRDRPTQPMMYVNLGLPEKLFLRIEENAKSSFRTVAQEINFRLTRDLDANSKVVSNHNRRTP